MALIFWIANLDATTQNKRLLDNLQPSVDRHLMKIFICGGIGVADICLHIKTLDKAKIYIHQQGTVFLGYRLKHCNH